MNRQVNVLGHRLDLSYLFPVIVIAGVVLYEAHNLAVIGPQSARMQSRLEEQFHEIAPLAGSQQVSYDASHSGDKPIAGVSAAYLTGASDQEISQHYHTELLRAGWRFVDREPFGDLLYQWTGWTERYCKPGEQASVSYYGHAAHYPWTFSFGISWRPSEACSG